jgi:hypothetical protein
VDFGGALEIQAGARSCDACGYRAAVRNAKRRADLMGRLQNYCKKGILICDLVVCLSARANVLGQDIKLGFSPLRSGRIVNLV